MPKFHLNPTITQSCPCGNPVTFVLLVGKQVVKCEACQQVLSFQLPDEQTRTIQGLIAQFEATVNSKLTLQE